MDEEHPETQRWPKYLYLAVGLYLVASALPLMWSLTMMVERAHTVPGLDSLLDISTQAVPLVSLALLVLAVAAYISSLLLHEWRLPSKCYAPIGLAYSIPAIGLLCTTCSVFSWPFLSDTFRATLVVREGILILLCVAAMVAFLAKRTWARWVLLAVLVCLVGVRWWRVAAAPDPDEMQRRLLAEAQQTPPIASSSNTATTTSTIVYTGRVVHLPVGPGVTATFLLLVYAFLVHAEEKRTPPPSAALPNA